MFIEWNEKLETGIYRIDEQHKYLIELINKLHDNVIVKKVDSLVTEILLDLKIYTINHFTTEEKMLTKYNFPDEENHIKEHQKFINMISENLFDNDTEKITQGYRLLEFLKEWLTDHILVDDMAYVSYFRKQAGFLADIQNDIK